MERSFEALCINLAQCQVAGASYMNSPKWEEVDERVICDVGAGVQADLCVKSYRVEGVNNFEMRRQKKKTTQPKGQKALFIVSTPRKGAEAAWLQ